ncbi:MAG: COX15/CtaA family protein [bacterium]
MRHPRPSRLADLAPNALIVWLWLCILLVFSLVLLGGAVRLSGAGLSMVEWRPLAGVLPPLDAAAWQRAFAKYQASPEFKLLHAGMNLVEFQFIFWMEYAHRLLGRVVALAFLLPFLFFLWRRMVPRGVAWRLWMLFALGALQGLLGWHMVRSGLINVPQVSHYRLMMHLLLAALIYAYMLRVVVGLSRISRVNQIGRMSRISRIARISRVARNRRARADAAVRVTGALAMLMLMLMLASGALVAGTRAGYILNTWPKMGGQWLPTDALVMYPWWLNLFENPATIQFVHRWLAALALLAAGGFALRLMRAGQARFGTAVLGLALAQVALGIATLTLRVPPDLAIAHQAGAMALLGAVVIALSANLSPLVRAVHSTTSEST